MATKALQDKKYSLTWQLTCDSNSQLVPVVIVSGQNTLFCRKITFHIPLIPYYKYHYTDEMYCAERGAY